MSSVKRHGSMSSSAHPRGHHAEHHELAHTLPAHHHYDTEWEAKEELRLRELEEARARAAQMEKTMRWWSDCTANWREKWSKVRTERNKAREESRIFRTKFDASVKECNNLKREKQDLENELHAVRDEILQLKLQKSPNNNNLPALVMATPERDVTSEKKEKLGHSEPLKLDLKRNNMNKAKIEQESQNDHDVVTFKSEMVQTSPVFFNRTSSNFDPIPDLEYLDKLLKPEKDIELEAISKDQNFYALNSNELSESIEDKVKLSPSKLIDSLLTPTQDYSEQRLSLYQLRLEEAVKTLQVEREEKTQLHKTHEKVQQDLNQMKMKFDDLKQSKQEALKELNQVKAEHQDEIQIIRLDLEDETNSRSSMDRRVADLRSQLETLQAENAAETRNKKLRTHIQDLEERLDRRNKQLSSASDSDCKTLQQEIHDKNKELAELKHAHSKLKKILQDKTTELGHAIRRSEQYETEVKKLRLRVEELKKELAIAEDEVDSATNNIRKLQRTNDELQEQVDSLQVQVEHLQTRLRSTNHSLICRRGSASRLHTDLSEDESTN
uniref:Myosin tail domain-containing protein n=1 Tax=Strigamia maritima TaxID=126957 RepID=T1JPH0_STRMM